jgi:outer membrane protein assembly factor BamA
MPFMENCKLLKSIIRLSQVVLYKVMRKEQSDNWKIVSGRVIFVVWITTVILLSACNPARRVTEGQYLLKHNAVVYPGATQGKGRGLGKKISVFTTQELNSLTITPEIAPQFILSYIKQKPNTKILGIIPLHLFVYNLVNPEKASEKKLEHDQKIDAKNRKRIAEGKSPMTDDQIKAKKQKKTWREWLMNAGEPPVILDSELMTASLKQIKLFLQSKGFYDCKVRDSVSVEKKKAKVFYIIRPGKPYKIDSLKYVCEDAAMIPVLYADSANCLINQGDNFDRDIILKERDRITHYLNDNGYYAFTKEYIHFDVDSALTSHHVNITIGVKKFERQDTLNPDSVIETEHPIFHIGNVVIQMQYNPSNSSYQANDSTLIGDYKMVYPKGQMGFKLKRLLKKVFIKKGEIYRISNVDNTYTGFVQLKTFRYISIKFVAMANNVLNCYIQLMPTLPKSIGVDAEGTNTSGDLGVQGDLAFDNNNLFRGAELFQFKLRGAFEAQKIIGTTTGSNAAVPFNTIDIGPELDLSIPRTLFPFNLGANIDSIDSKVFHHKSSLGLWPKANPQTIFKLTYDYQNRPTDYNRNIFGLAYTFNYDPYEKKNQHKWNISLRLPEINYVHATLFPAFQSTLQSLNNYFLFNSFTNHFIPDIGITVQFDDQGQTKQRNFDFVKVSLEESGWLLRAFTPLVQGNGFFQLVPDPTESYSLFNVPYSYYVKGDLDYRHYFVLSKDDKIVLRGFAGMGAPMAGVPQELPFDKSYWAGGSNDIRAWEARTLGPGANTQQIIVDQIGDIKLEANAEYRVSIIKVFGLGFFVDAGNIWLLNPNSSIPNGNFLLKGPNAFYNQIAVGAGFGLRFDFTYFVFRLDFGWQLRNPALPLGHDWDAAAKLPLLPNAVNFGIGYPF